MLREGSAERQVTGVSGAQHASAPTWQKALDLWTEHCLLAHNHSPSPCISHTVPVFHSMLHAHAAPAPPASSPAPRATFRAAPSTPVSAQARPKPGAPASARAPCSNTNLEDTGIYALANRRGEFINITSSSPAQSRPSSAPSRPAAAGMSTPPSSPSKRNKFYAVSGSPVIYRDR